MSTELMVAILGLAGVVVTAAVGVVIAWISKSKAVVHRHEGAVVHRYEGSVGVGQSAEKDDAAAYELAPLCAHPIANRARENESPKRDTNITKIKDQENFPTLHPVNQDLNQNTPEPITVVGMIERCGSEADGGYYSDGNIRLEITINRKDAEDRLQWREGGGVPIILVINGVHYETSLLSRPKSDHHKLYISLNMRLNQVKVRLSDLLADLGLGWHDKVEFIVSGYILTLTNRRFGKEVQ
jgi:hypothetical protein